MKVDRVLIRSIQIEATWLPVPQHVRTICLLLGFWLKPVYSNGPHPVHLSSSVSCVMSAAHNAQQEKRGDGVSTLAHGRR